MRRNDLLLLAGLACTGIFSAAAQAQTAPVAGPATSETYADCLTEAASRFALPLSWIHVILRVESAGQAQATSSKGAMGLMQIMPATWAFLRDRLQLGRDPYDPHDNIIAGAAYIRMLVDRYGSPGWIAAYNAGPGRYEASLNGRALPAETRAYTAAVAARLQRDGSSGTNIVTVIPVVWTQAPLFIVHSVRTPMIGTVQRQRVPDDASVASRERHPPTMAVRSIGLFVAQSGIGTAP